MSSPHLINTTVGEYRLVDFLGAGGMGEVYRGVHTKIGRVAAIKVLTQAARDSTGFVERFFNEARIQASLQHPNIATLYDFLEVQGQPCIVMEYVDGQTLSERIGPCGPLPLPDTLYVFSAVAEAIGYIHRHGIIHRDIKSNNIKISSAGQVKLLDFGIAKGLMSPGLTETGSVVGTLAYISPEQLSTGVSDARSDIWALGVLLYEMATGRVPFEEQTLGALCDKIGRVEYAPPARVNPSTPREVANIITRCLKKNPAERYQTADALLLDVQQACALASVPKAAYPDGGTLAATPVVAAEGSWARRNWLKLSGVAALAGVLLIFAAAGAYFAFGGNVGQTMNGAGTSASNSAAAGTPGGASKTVKIDMSDGPAEIWFGQQSLGKVRSADLNTRVGERVTLTLKRDGYEPRTVSFEVTANKTVYTFSISK